MLTLKALEEGSRSSEEMLVYHLLLSSVKTLSVLEKTVDKATRMSRKLQKVNKLTCSLDRGCKQLFLLRPGVKASLHAAGLSNVGIYPTSSELQQSFQTVGLTVQLVGHL